MVAGDIRGDKGQQVAAAIYVVFSIHLSDKDDIGK
jgi:hypothetical protein